MIMRVVMAAAVIMGMVLIPVGRLAMLACTVLADRSIRMAHPSIGQMNVVVVVLVDRDARPRPVTEELQKLRAL